MKVVADLHTHTTVSDGRLTPGQLVAHAAAIGLPTLVITDHSAVVYEAVRPVAARLGVDLPFPGLEVSTHFAGRKHHICLYGDALGDPTLQQRLRIPADRKRRIATTALDRLRIQGFDLPPLSQLLARSTEPVALAADLVYPARTPIATALAELSGDTFAAAHQRVVEAFVVAETELGGDDPLAAHFLPTPLVLGLAARHGLFATLAHPLWQCRDDGDVDHVCEVIEQFVPLGLRGCESRSYHHRPLDDHPRLLATRRALNLVPTGGSDFHGNGKTELGRGGLTQPEFDRLRTEVVRRHREVA